VGLKVKKIALCIIIISCSSLLFCEETNTSNLNRYIENHLFFINDYWSGIIIKKGDRSYPEGFFGFPQSLIDQLSTIPGAKEKVQSSNGYLSTNNILSFLGSACAGIGIGIALLNNDLDERRYISIASAAGGICLFLIGRIFGSIGYSNILEAVDLYNKSLIN
jgi:hypothetical protein